MMGKKNGCFAMLKIDNPDLLIIHCVIHRENLVAKSISPELHKVMKAVTRCVNSIKAGYVRLLLHTEVRWLSKGNCLKRFIQMFDTL